MTMEEFVRQMSRSDAKEYIYFSTNINNVNEVMLDLYPWEYLEKDPTSQKQNMNFWMGKKGTVADTHYDGYYNLYVQVSPKVVHNLLFLTSFFLEDLWKKKMDNLSSKRNTLSISIFASQSRTISGSYTQPRLAIVSID